VSAIDSVPPPPPVADQPAVRIVVVDEVELVRTLGSIVRSELGPDRGRDTSDAREALGWVERERPALLVTDVRRPGLSGPELIARTRELWGAVPVVVMTAFPSSEVRSGASVGSFTYLPKPFPLRALLDAVRGLDVKPPPSYSGAAAVITLADLLRLYATAGATGALAVLSGGLRGEVWFDMTLGIVGGGPSLNLENAGASNAEVVRAKRKAMKSFNLKDDIADILVTLGRQYHLTRPLRSRRGVFFYVALERARAPTSPWPASTSPTPKKTSPSERPRLAAPAAAAAKNETMAFFDPERGRVTVRLVYDGPGTAGKATNVRRANALFTLARRGEVVAPAKDKAGRTLFFDWDEPPSTVEGLGLGGLAAADDDPDLLPRPDPASSGADERRRGRARGRHASRARRPPAAARRRRRDRAERRRRLGAAHRAVARLCRRGARPLRPRRNGARTPRRPLRPRRRRLRPRARRLRRLDPGRRAPRGRVARALTRACPNAIGRRPQNGPADRTLRGARPPTIARPVAVELAGRGARRRRDREPPRSRRGGEEPRAVANEPARRARRSPVRGATTSTVGAPFREPEGTSSRRPGPAPARAGAPPSRRPRSPARSVVASRAEVAPRRSLAHRRRNGSSRTTRSRTSSADRTRPTRSASAAPKRSHPW
jgi:CheY-like chemotaxis protein